ncbi:hypothetical protein TcasGA2_TC013471 [Tribolium castaneum]|uniref:Uncharacterized protein n=1 Tax=Tribolium castaneum TaxID=7070 RepID=D6WLB8_TRICA|nr:hypothetical protein TcasGA2_TC013471 [Tribolium castaneum]
MREFYRRFDGMSRTVRGLDFRLFSDGTPNWTSGDARTNNQMRNIVTKSQSSRSNK